MGNPEIKIAVIGNMNNNNFSVVRYLHDLGFNADLLLFENEYAHFNPRCDSYDEDYKSYTKQLSWGNELNLLDIDKKQIINDLKGYTHLFGTGFAPAYLNRVGLNLDVFIPCGYDIMWGTKYRLTSKFFFKLLVSAYYQKNGVKNSSVIHLVETNKYYESLIVDYFKSNVRWNKCLPMVYAPQYDFWSIDKMLEMSKFGKKFEEIRNSSDLMIVSQCRQFWYNKASHLTKGNDKLIMGFSAFCSKYPNVNAKLVLFEYGIDVIHSKSLIEKLNLGEMVVWMPLMDRKDLMPGLLICDVVAAEFGESWITSGTLFEALVAGKPILAYRDDEQYRHLFNELYPIYNCSNSESITQCIEDYHNDKSRGVEIGLLGKSWYNNQIVTPALSLYKEYIVNKNI